MDFVSRGYVLLPWVCYNCTREVQMSGTRILNRAVIPSWCDRDLQILRRSMFYSHKCWHIVNCCAQGANGVAGCRQTIVEGEWISVISPSATHSSQSTIFIIFTYHRKYLDGSRKYSYSGLFFHTRPYIARRGSEIMQKNESQHASGREKERWCVVYERVKVSERQGIVERVRGKRRCMVTKSLLSLSLSLPRAIALNRAFVSEIRDLLHFRVGESLGQFLLQFLNCRMMFVLFDICLRLLPLLIFVPHLATFE